MKLNILHQLHEQNVCYCIVREIESIAITGVDRSQHKYILVGSIADRGKLYRLGFFKNHGGYQQDLLFIYKLTPSETRTLLQHDIFYFTKTVETQDGAVWELPHWSFKAHHNSRKDAYLAQMARQRTANTVAALRAR
jgi:hypothetical protein